MRGGWLGLAAAAALLPVAPSAGQPAPPIVPTAERAGINLPAQLCAMTQERLDSSPSGIYAIYRLAADSTLRIYINRAAQSVDGEFNDNGRAIAGSFGDVVFLRDLPAPTGAPEARARVWRGIWDGSRVMTGLWLWHHDGLRIKLRGTVPLGEAERLWPEIECAVRTLSATAH